MAFIPHALAAGYLTDTAFTLYEVPASSAVYVRNIWMTNESADTQEITTYLLIAGVLRLWRTFELEYHEVANILDGENALILEGGHGIVALTTNNGAVSYQLSGVVESL